MNKPDRFDRAVAKRLAVDECGPNTIWAQSAVMLLRKEHASMKRMVTAYRKNMWANGSNAVNEGRLQACYDILAALDKRRE